MMSLPNLGLLVLRCTFASMMFLNHGLEKFTNFSTVSSRFPNPIGIGSEWSAGLVVFAELFMSIFIFFGLFTRIACIPPVIAMGVAAFMIHANDALERKELALLYFAAYVAIMLLGPGIYSLDKKFRNKI